MELIESTIKDWKNGSFPVSYFENRFYQKSKLFLSKLQKFVHFLKLYKHSQKKNLLNFLVSEFCVELLSVICSFFQILAHYVRPIGKCWVVCCQRKVKVLALLTLITNSTVDRKLLSYHQLEENGGESLFHYTYIHTNRKP